MSTPGPASRAERTLEVVEHVLSVLQSHGVDAAVIGAMAMAIHNYPRSTEDFDLATDTDPYVKLRPVAAELRAAGYDAELNEPDFQDSLGGLIRLSGPDFDTIDIINFYNPHARGCGALASEALRSAQPAAVPGSKLKVVDLPHLIALKLYAGGLKSKLDVLELIQRNPAADMAAIRDVCVRFGLGEQLEPLLKEAGRS